MSNTNVSIDDDLKHLDPIMQDAIDLVRHGKRVREANDAALKANQSTPKRGNSHDRNKR